MSKVYPRPERPALLLDGNDTPSLDLDASTSCFGGVEGSNCTLVSLNDPATALPNGAAAGQGMGAGGERGLGGQLADSGSLMDLVCEEQRGVVQSLAEHVVYGERPPPLPRPLLLPSLPCTASLNCYPTAQYFFSD